MESLDSPTHYLWKPREFFDLDVWDRLVPEQCRRAAGRNDLNTHLAEATSERHDAHLIRNRNESALNLHESQKNNRFSFLVYRLALLASVCGPAHFPGSVLLRRV